MKPIIAIIAGGYSGEYSVSIRSASGIISWIDRELFTPYLYIIEGNRWYVKTDDTNEMEVDRGNFGFTLDGITIKPDYAFITIHGTPGENGILQGYLDMLNIPYNTGGVLTEALTFNKFVCNRYLSTFTGIRTAKSLRLTEKVSDEHILQAVNALGSYPVFVKPNTGGSSVATSRVDRAEELITAINLAFSESTEVMVECLIKGIEVTCGAYTHAGEVTILEITEVSTQNKFFDFDAKYNGQVEEITPARIPEEQATTIRTLTKQIYQHIQAKGIIRVDYIIEPDGYPTLLEVNTTPGMTPTSFIPQQVAACGMSMKDVLTEIIQSTLTH